jgi:hypothetical protein
MGIDPISLIVAALAAGAAAAAKDTASQAVKDAYNGLKALIHKRFAGRPEASVALTQHELAPQVWQAPLKDSLDKTGAANDPIILEAARRLDTVLRQEGGGVSATGPGSVAVAQAENVAVQGGAVVAPKFQGGVTNSAIVNAGRDVTGQVTNSIAAGQDLRAHFAPVLVQVRARPADPDVSNSKIQQKVESIRDEAAKGADANPRPIARWLSDLGSLAPDIRDLVAAKLRDAGGAVSVAVREAVDQVVASSG